MSKIITPKEYAEMQGCSQQNITKKIRKYNGIVGVKKAKAYLNKALPGVVGIENIHTRCVLLRTK